MTENGNGFLMSFVRNQLASIVVVLFLSGGLYTQFNHLVDKVDDVENVQNEYRKHIHKLETTQAVLNDDMAEVKEELKELTRVIRKNYD